MDCKAELRNGLTAICYVFRAEHWWQYPVLLARTIDQVERACFIPAWTICLEYNARQKRGETSRKHCRECWVEWTDGNPRKACFRKSKVGVEFFRNFIEISRNGKRKKTRFDKNPGKWREMLWGKGRVWRKYCFEKWKPAKYSVNKIRHIGKYGERYCVKIIESEGIEICTRLSNNIRFLRNFQILIKVIRNVLVTRM